MLSIDMINLVRHVYLTSLLLIKKKTVIQGAQSQTDNLRNMAGR
jgi:hypothetical protein